MWIVMMMWNHETMFSCCEVTKMVVVVVVAVAVAVVAFYVSFLHLLLLKLQSVKIVCSSNNKM